MNGIHDMGGMDGFGRVEPEGNEPVFHADWEKRVFALVNGTLRLTGANVDEFRHAIERIPPARYLASSYYERWRQAVETLLLERGIVTREELEALPAPEFGAAAVPAVAPSQLLTKASKPRARFKAGDRVRVRNINPAGHTRSPRYVRGKTGIVRRDYGTYVFPDTNAHRVGGDEQHVYSVEFTARELWERKDRERLLIDLWEDYLEPAQGTRKSAGAGHPHPRVMSPAKKSRGRATPPSSVKRTGEGKKRRTR
jgi:nitrile hydratase subunit beta